MASMVSKFLSFVDTATQFGYKHISGNELLRMFGELHGLNAQRVEALRYTLESKGIL